MHLLIIGVHAVFVFVAYLLGSVLMQGVFFLLGIFFLLYFSPLFFETNEKENIDYKKEIAFLNIKFSPKDSVIIPLILAYISLYILAFTAIPEAISYYTLHIVLFGGIFILFGGYILVFGMSSDFFRESLRLHLILSYITIFGTLFYCISTPIQPIVLIIIFLLLVIGFSLFFFYNFHHESLFLFSSFLLAFVFSLAICIFSIFPIHLSSLFGIIGILSIVLFEYIPRIRFFSHFLVSSRIMLVTLILLISIFLVISSVFFGYTSLGFLPIFTIFLFSLHIRYSNYIAYSIALAILYFIYTFIFYDLVLAPDIISSLLFLFFLPLCIVGNTYFWEEKYVFDFPILHYSSIFYSITGTLYSLLFVPWGDSLMIFLSCAFFLLSVLFLLSYFRFQYK